VADTPPLPRSLHGGAFRRILVGFDASPEAQRALRAAVALAEEVRGDVCVLVVVRPPAHVETPSEAARSTAAQEEQLSRGLATVRRPTGRVISKRVVYADDPAAALAEHAEAHGFDIVVVGSHGQDYATHRGIGHSLEALLRRHPCPVLVV
jgi:nucleotide-binding universal stress UspA family protein